MRILKRQTYLFLCVMLLVGLNEIKAQIPDEHSVSWKSYKEAVQAAEMHQKKIMLFLEADWCTVCKRMHREVFTDLEVIQIMNSQFYPVSIDIESPDTIVVKGERMTKKDFSKESGIYGTPTILFLNPKEDVIGNFVGYSDKKDMLKLLNFISSEAYLNEALDNYSYE